jgi:hypothetical protein
MRAWIIVVSSAVVALAAATALVWPELGPTRHAALFPTLLLLLPTLVVAALAVYALCAILLVSGGLIAEALRLRRDLDRNPPHHGPARPSWIVTLEGNGLRRLVPPLAVAQPRPPRADGTVVLQGQFRPREARREVGRLYYIGAARAHFWSALVVLAAGVVLGTAQQHGALPSLPGPIPTIPAALAVAGLVLLAILARIAVDVTAEPLVEMISRLPAESTEAGLLRRATELLETAGATNPAHDLTTPLTSVQIPDRLVAVLEQGHRALFDAIGRLSTAADGLATTTTSSIEALEAALRATELRQLSAPQEGAADVAERAQLRVAVTALTGVLERVRSAPVSITADADPSSSLPLERDRGLADELRQLLQEIETTR